MKINAKTRRRMPFAALALAVLAVAVRAMRPESLPVDAAPVRRGPLAVTIDEDGVTRVHDRYVVSAPVAGRVQRTALREGDAVEPGMVVARIASAPLDVRTARQSGAAVAAAQALRAEAAARLTEARAALAQARREAARRRTLEEAGALSREQREQAELAVETRSGEVRAAQARLAAADAEIASARAGLADADPGAAAAGTITEVRSPVRGRVLRVPQESESMVAAGAPLVELGDARALEVVVDVLSTDAVRVEPGMAVRVEEWGGGRALAGRVRTVAPSAFTRVSALGVEEQRVNVVADLDEPAGRLGDNYRVEARIVAWEGTDVLKVPVSALFRTGERWSVFVVDAGRARLRAVEVGHRGDAEAEVIRGLREGEQVILYPSDQVEDGVRVAVSGGGKEDGE